MLYSYKISFIKIESFPWTKHFFRKLFKLNTLFYYIVKHTQINYSLPYTITECVSKQLLNVFPNNTIINLVYKQYKTLAPTFLIIFF